MRTLYSSGIILYGLLIRAAAWFNPKAKQWIKGRANLFSDLEKSIADKPGTYVWIHCASLGEFEQGRPLIEKIKSSNPACRILLSFFSPSGFEVRKNYSGADVVCYLPLDTRGNAIRFLNIVNPAAVIFVKYEFWLNHLNEISKRKIPHYLVSAIFRNDQIFFKGYGGIFRDALKSYTRIFTQNEESMTLITGIGIKNVSVAGDTRFDRVSEIAAGAKEISLAANFSRGANVIVAGSTWKADEDALFPALRNHFSKGWKMIIAPHEISEDRLTSIENSVGVDRSKVIRFSKASAEAASLAQILIIDNIGMLSSLYCYGSVAYIGGGFGKSIHNTLEAAVYGIPVVFGPMYNKFNEAMGLIACKGGYGVHSAAELQQILDELLTNESKRVATGKNAGEFVRKNTGASKIILSQLEI